MKYKWFVIFGGIFALMLFGGLSLFFLLFEKREVELSIPPSPEARANPYLAAERLWQKYGIEVDQRETLTNIEEIPTLGHALFIWTPLRPEDREHALALCNWVESGGTLIATISTTEEEGRLDPFLKMTGLEPSNLLENTGITEVEFPNLLEPLKVDPSTSTIFWITDLDAVSELDELAQSLWEPEISSDYEDGSFLLGTAYGKGYIFLTFSNEPLTNDQIGEQQHAEYLMAMTTIKGIPEKVISVSFNEVKPFLVILFEASPPFFYTLALVLIFLFWQHLPRTHPTKPNPPAERRRLLEHLLFEGRLMLKAGRQQEIWQSQRRAVFKLILKHIPNWETLPEERKYELLANISKVKATQIRFALTDEPTKGESSLTQKIVVLETMRSSL